MESLFWYDYETSGADPKRDRPFQVAGIRTDLDLNEIEAPVEWFCKPSNDLLPHPDACLITGITPQMADAKGLIEREFIARIHEQLSRPGTCTVGYNNLRFDDELTRFSFYRNFHDAYAWHWQNGNSRWDLIDTVRSCYALRPDGLEWPEHEPGKPSFKLEHLCAANNIEQQGAHDAVVDVRATIGLARLIRSKQRGLFDYLFKLRNKHEAANLIELNKPVMHVSRMIPADLGCTSMFLPIAQHAQKKDSKLSFDLRHDPRAFADLDDDELLARAFTSSAELGEDRPRLPIKEIQSNHCPALFPAKMLDQKVAERVKLDLPKAREHYDWLRDHPEFAQRISRIFNQDRFTDPSDPELMLYSGGFFGQADKQMMERITKTPTAELASLTPRFQDARLDEMWFRYRARNAPEQLNEDEIARWEDFRFERLTNPSAEGSLTLEQFDERVEALMNSPDTSETQRKLLEALLEYAENLLG